MTDWQPGMRITAERLGGVIMDWTPLVDIGTFAANFSAGNPTPRMRKIDHAGTEVWELEGSIAVAAFTSGTSITAFTFDPGYRVGVIRGVQCYGNGSEYYGIRTAFTSSGALIVGVPAAVTDTVSSFLLDGVRITNPIG